MGMRLYRMELGRIAYTNKLVHHKHINVYTSDYVVIIIIIELDDKGNTKSLTFSAMQRKSRHFMLDYRE